MDKNTLTGLVLMALVIFGFFWLTKPSEADIKARQQMRSDKPKPKTRALYS